MYNFKFKFEKDDYIKINQILIKNSKSFTTAYAMLKYSVPVFSIIMPLYYMRTFNMLAMLITVTFTVFWLTWFPRFFKKSTASKLGKKIDEINDQTLYFEKNIIVKEDGFSGHIARNVDHVGFDKVLKIKDVDDYIFVYLTKVQAFVIPKSVIKNLEGFTNYVNSRIGTKQL